MTHITIITRRIGDLRTVVGVYNDYRTASDLAQELQKKAHAQGYTDFKWVCEEFELNKLKYP